MRLAVVQARMTSSRLPGKTLMDIAGQPMLSLILKRLMLSKKLDEIIVATTTDIADFPIVELCGKLGVRVVCGSRDNVLERVHAAVMSTSADAIVRITADCPLIDPNLIDHALIAFSKERACYLSCGAEEGYPRGINAEIISRRALEIAASEAVLPYELEHVTPFIYCRPDRFKLVSLSAPKELMRPNYRITVDEPCDLEMVRNLVQRIGKNVIKINIYDIVQFLDLHPEIVTLNGSVQQKHFTDSGR